MYATRRWWVTAGFGVVLIALGVLAERPVLLYGAAGLGAWLVATAVQAARRFARLDEALEVTYDLSVTDAMVDSHAPATLTVKRAESADDPSVTVSTPLPPGLEAAGDRTVTLQAGTVTASSAFTVTFPIAGAVTFPRPVVEIVDGFGLYRERFRRGPAPSVTVHSRTPDVHVGRGGERTRSAYGEHETDRPGPGVTTRDIREYTPGDALRRIDWKATARLGDPYVRETEGEADRRLVIVLDHRDRMDVGRPGRTMLDYGREVALGITAAAERDRDPLGVQTIGGAGITTAIDPGSTSDTYGRIESTLLELASAGDDAGRATRSAASSRRIHDRLTADGEPFSRVLRGYVGETETYVQRLRDDPLVDAVRQLQSRFGTDTWTAIVTSDADPVRVREAVDLATGGGRHVLVFLTPQCLFEPAGVTDLDAAYDRYLAFETLRRELDGHPRVTAFEIAPGDRLDAVLANRRTERVVSR